MKKPQLWILLGSCVWSWSRSKQASLQLFTLRISLSDQKEEAGALLFVQPTFCIIAPASGHSRFAFADDEIK